MSTGQVILVGVVGWVVLGFVLALLNDDRPHRAWVAVTVGVCVLAILAGTVLTGIWAWESLG